MFSLLISLLVVTLVSASSSSSSSDLEWSCDIKDVLARVAHYINDDDFNGLESLFVSGASMNLVVSSVIGAHNLQDAINEGLIRVLKFSDLVRSGTTVTFDSVWEFTSPDGSNVMTTEAPGSINVNSDCQIANINDQKKRSVSDVSRKRDEEDDGLYINLNGDVVTILESPSFYEIPNDV